jgi:hypothetical protein
LRENPEHSANYGDGHHDVPIDLMKSDRESIARQGKASRDHREEPERSRCDDGDEDGR